MKNNISLILLFCLMLMSQFNLSLRAQIFSEAPVTISDKGERLSNMIYVKFLPGDLIEIPKDKKDVDGNFISEKFSDIRKTFSDFSKNRQFDLPDLKISKAIANAKDEDTLFIDVKTGEIKKLPNLARVFIIKFPKQVDIETIASELSRHKEVEYAHGPVQLVNCAVSPDDQYYTNGSQWYLDTIKAPAAWGITKGSSDIKIALIEKEGVELTHTDLQSKIAGGDNNPAGIIGSHGTNVAGFAGAVTNNGTPGVASLGWNTKLLTYQPYNEDSLRSVTAQKIKDAADAGAHVINLSFKTIKTGLLDCSGGIELSLKKTNSSNLLRLYYYKNWDYGLVRDAITYAVGKNAVVVASAGNTQETYDSGSTLPCESIPYPCYPAQYSNVIAVSGSQQNNNFVDGWNYGSFVSVNAPGRTDANTGLWSTNLNNSYTNNKDITSGTSFSAPQVSALAGLIKSLNPAFTPAQIKNIIEQSADKVGQYPYTNGIKNDYFGYGRINAYNALNYALNNYGFSNQMDMLGSLPISYTGNQQGAAAVKMLLNYVNQSTAATVQEIYTQSGATAAMNAENVKTALQYYTPNSAQIPNNYTWATYSNSDRNTVLNPIIKWVAYNYTNSNKPHPPNYVAGLVPFNSSFNDWVAVSGCYLSKDPWNGGNNYDATGMTVYGFWVTRPNDGGMGIGDTYYHIEVFNTYFLPIGGQYYGVVDPPTETYPLVYGEPIKLNLSDKTNILQELSTNLLPKLNKHKKFVEIFESIKFYEETIVTNLSTKGSYTIINIGKNKKTEAGIVVDNITSQLLEVNVPPAPVDYFILTSETAKNILSKSITINKDDLIASVPKLVYIKEYCSNLYYPLWEIAINDKKYYVSQDEKLIDVKLIGAPAINEKNGEGSLVLQNYPNPFNPVTQIKFSLSAKEHVRLEVFDLLGRKIATLVDEERQAGSYSIPFNGNNLPSGMYLYRLTAGAKSESKKMLLIK